jgi:CSLREA domain-containing protein
VTSNQAGRSSRPLIRRRARACVTAFAVLAAVVVVIVPAAPVAAATLTVTTTLDALGDDGECSLREAIINANTDSIDGSDDCAPGSGDDTIAFAIPGDGPHIIAVITPLPSITAPVVIDGYSQPGTTPNTSLIGSNASLEVGIEAVAPTAGNGLVVDAAGTVIRGMVIIGFDGDAGSAGIAVNAEATIEGNFIGVAVNGATANPNNYGILVTDADDVTIGSSDLGDLAARNVISGNVNDGVYIQGTSTTTIVSGNVIGLDRTGISAVPNLSGVCACAQLGSGASIVGNVLSGNAAAGIYVASVGTTMLRNFIGTDATGLEGVANFRGGIVSGFDSRNTLIGDGTASGRNVISGNLDEGGISLGGTTELGTSVRGNFIGVGVDGLTPIGNSRGIWVIAPGATDVQIGGTGPGDGNIIANNLTSGVVVAAGTGTSIVGNFMSNHPDRGIVLSGNTLNDEDDEDAGPNNYQNWPILLSATAGNNLVVEYEIGSAATFSAYPIQIDVYVADSVDGDGGNPVGQVSAPAPGMYTADLGPVDVMAGTPLTATATDADGNTSEFSPTVTATDAPSTPGKFLGPTFPDLRPGFGYDVDISGDTAIVGESTGFPGSGRATIYTRDAVTGGWFETQVLGSDADRFGRYVAIDGNLAAVSSPDVVSPQTLIYRRPNPLSEWSLVASLPDTGDVDISDGMLVIGDPLGTNDSGLMNAKVYDLLGPLDDLENRLQQVLWPWGGGAPEPLIPTYGERVAIHYDRDTDTGSIAISAPSRETVYTFVKTTPGQVWNPNPIAVLTSPDGSEQAFGASLAIGPDRLVVGEPFNGAVPGEPDAGAVWVYEGTAASYSAPVRLLASDIDVGNQFGRSVATDGDTILVGSPWAGQTDVPFRAGAAYVFELDAVTWAERDVLRATDGQSEDQLGFAVALDGVNALIGAPRDDNENGVDAGAVYAFDFSPPPSLEFDLGLAAGESPTLAVAPSGIAVNLIDRNVAEGRGTASATVAASSITSIGVEDTALSSIRLGSTPLSAIVIDSDVLSSIPLVNIDIEGGWARVIAGTDLEQVPLVNLTFGRVLTTGSPLDITSPAGRVANTPLSAIDVEGTPLSAIPLSAIALGSTPLSAIPLSAIGGDSTSWCPIIANIEPNCDQALLQELTLMEVTLRGVPLSAIPLSAIPLSAIDLQASPLSAIPLSAIDLAASPLSAIPLSAIPLSAIDVQGAPLSAIPLSAIPLSAIPLSAIDLQASPLSAIPLSAIPLSAIPTSIPLSAIPLSAIDLQGTPLSAIQVQGAPLSAIPLSAIMLADTPLSAIPLSAIGPTDWCGVLSAGGGTFNCDTGVDIDTTTLRELSVRGVPLSAIPLSAIPLSAIDVQGAPLSAIPLSAIPLSAIPLSAIPLSAIDVQGTPLSAIPLSAIDIAGSPLSAIPLSAIPLSAIPLSAIPLSAIPLSAIPLSAIPLSAIQVQGAPLSAIPLSAIDVISSPLSAIPLSAIPLSAIGVDCQLVSCTRGTLGDAVRAGAIPGSTTLVQIQQATSGIRLGELAPYLQGITVAELAAAIAANGGTLGDLPSLDDMQLGDLPRSLFELQLTQLGDLGAGLNGVTFDDLVGNLTDPFTGRPIVGIDLDFRFAINALESNLGSLDSLGDVTLGELVENGPLLTLADIEPLLGFLTVDTVERALGVTITIGSETLADLTADELGQLTLGDLARLDQAGAVTLEELLGELGAERLRGFTLGDLLRALVDPSSLALGGVQFDTVNVSALPAGTVPPAAFTAAFTLNSQQASPISIDIALPSTAAYLPGSTLITPVPVGDTEPVVTSSTLQWNVIAEPGVAYEIRFDVAPSLRLGVTSLGGTARVVGTDIVVPATAAVTVREGIEPNDFELVAPASTLRETTPAIEDVVYLTYISTPTDIDVFELDLADNDRLIVSLSNLDVDLDVVLWRRPEGATVGGALSRTSTESPLFPIVDPDADAVDAEPLADFPRLDALDPTLQLVAVSNGAGLVDEYLSTDRLAAGTYFVQVFGANGAVTVDPAALQLKVVEADALPVCRAIDLPADHDPVPDSAGHPGRRRHADPRQRDTSRADVRGRWARHRDRRSRCAHRVPRRARWLRSRHHARRGAGRRQRRESAPRTTPGTRSPGRATWRPRTPWWPRSTPRSSTRTATSSSTS